MGGLVLYGIGALLSAISPGLGVLILGNSVLEGVGTALLIPPVYILTTIAFSNLTSRAKAFGVISGLGGIGAAAGPLIGGLITTAISWRAAFVFQALVVATIIVLSRKMVDPVAPDPTRPFDVVGAVLSAVGMFFFVLGILQADSNLALMAVLMVVGAAFLAGFFLFVRRQERAGKEAAPLHQPVQEPHLERRPRHPERPVAAPDGRVVRGRGLPADRARLQRDRDGRDLHGGDARRPADVLRRGAVRQPPHPEDADPGRLRHDDRRHRAS